MVDLETLFKTSDFITIHLKTIPGVTEGMITKDFLNKCKNTCFIENQASSKLINRDDLIDALKNNRISGYGATLNNYTNDFKNLENVILLPANAPAEYRDRSTLWNSVENAEKRKNHPISFFLGIKVLL